jgi:hypothetical protein
MVGGQRQAPGRPARPYKGAWRDVVQQLQGRAAENRMHPARRQIGERPQNEGPPVGFGMRQNECPTPQGPARRPTLDVALHIDDIDIEGPWAPAPAPAAPSLSFQPLQSAQESGRRQVRPAE